MKWFVSFEIDDDFLTQDGRQATLPEMLAAVERAWAEAYSTRKDGTSLLTNLSAIHTSEVL